MQDGESILLLMKRFISKSRIRYLREHWLQIQSVFRNMQIQNGGSKMANYWRDSFITRDLGIFEVTNYDMYKWKMAPKWPININTYKSIQLKILSTE